MAKSTRQYVFEGMELLPAALIPFVEKRLETSLKGHWQVQVLEKRLRNRSAAEKMSDEVVIQKRLAGARNELKRVWEYKYALVNDILENAVEEMRAIVLYERGEDEYEATALSCRTDAASPKLKAVLEAFGEK